MFEVEDTRTVLVGWVKDAPGEPDLPEGWRFVHRIPREEERALLETAFTGVDRPLGRGMPGYRDDSLLALVSDEKTIALGYLCERNEYGIEGRVGEGHYVVVHPDYRGQGAYQYLYAGLSVLARKWGLEGVAISTDRRGLADVYVRWGAEVVRSGPKDEVKPITSGPRRSLARRLGSRLRRMMQA